MVIVDMKRFVGRIKGQDILRSIYKRGLLFGILLTYTFILIACSKNQDNDLVGDIGQLINNDIDGDDLTYDINEDIGDQDYMIGSIDKENSLENEESEHLEEAAISVEGVYVIGDGVRMREEASINSDVIMQLGNGSYVEYIDYEGEWIKVQYEGHLGYIRKDLISEVKPSNSLLEENNELINDPEYVIDNPKIVVKKNDRILELWDGEEVFASYKIGLGRAPLGDKQREGDGRTPEGTYYVCTRNNYSRFYLSLGVSYPNKEDAKEAFDKGLIDRSTYEQIDTAISQGIQPPWNTALGGEIMIHGHGSHSDWTQGCVAVDDEIMDILWRHCPLGTPIIIEP